MKHTVTMTINVEYDDSITDPAALSDALDALLETAMVLPGVMDTHFPVTVGCFHPDLKTIRKS